MAKRKARPYKFGEVFTNKYLGNRITEVKSTDGKRLGWVWEHSDGRVVVSPHLGFYIWFAEGGAFWTKDSAAVWLVNSARG
jgi:hypothetical protein